MKIKIGIVGYGNVGKGVHSSILKNEQLHSDVCLGGIITRRPENIKKILPDVTVVDFNGNLDIDVAILCGGSATDLPEQGPFFAKKYCTVDSFDTHAKIPEYYEKMNYIAKKSSKVSVISTGWDPGTFSLERTLFDAFLPGSNPVGFYGITETGGLSMGHSDAIRRIEGVADARQYTHAIPEAIEKAKKGETLTSAEMHWRECIVVAKDGYDTKKIESEIINMPNYFAPYKTTVKFVKQVELEKNYSGTPHNGIVIGTTLMGSGNRGTIEYKNEWDSNSEATANILVAHARAAYKLKKEGKSGAFTILDIPPAYLSPRSKEELLKNYL